MDTDVEYIADERLYRTRNRSSLRIGNTSKTNQVFMPGELSDQIDSGFARQNIESFGTICGDSQRRKNEAHKNIEKRRRIDT